MIRKESLRDEHLRDVANRLQIRDKQLLGRMTHALYLLDRLSIDVDIEVSETVADDAIEGALIMITSADSVFHRWEPNVRPRDVEGSKHYRVHYQQDTGRLGLREEFVILDVVRTAVLHQHTMKRALNHMILAQEGDPVQIVTPTPEGILGDKLTACAPLTVGVPIALPNIEGVTKDANKHLEMVKQLFDVNVLIPFVSDWDAVGSALTRTLDVQREVFNHDFTTERVILDLVQRALALFGQLEAEYHPDLVSSHQGGHRSLVNYLVNPGTFSSEQVRLAALRAAYVANCVGSGTTPMKVYPEITDSSLENSRIKDICKGLPKALKAEAVAKVEALLGRTP